MRLRNVKNKEEILNNCEQLIQNPSDYYYWYVQQTPHKI